MMFVFCRNNPIELDSFVLAPTAASSNFDTENSRESPIPTKPAT